MPPMLNGSFRHGRRTSGRVIAIIRGERFGLARLRTGVVWRFPLGAVSGSGWLNIGAPVEINYVRNSKGKPSVFRVRRASGEIKTQLDVQAAAKIKAAMKPKTCGARSRVAARKHATILMGVGHTRRPGSHRDNCGHA